MNLEEIEKWREAGKVAKDALHFGKELIQQDKKMLDITEKIETYVLENGGELAFPTNLAVNNVGAHWTPSSKTAEKFKKGDLVKLDVGVHIDGYIGDNGECFKKEKKKRGRKSKNVIDNIGNDKILTKKEYIDGILYLVDNMNIVYHF